MIPIPPICPFCNTIPEIDALCFFSCTCWEGPIAEFGFVEPTHFTGELKLIDIDNIDKGYQIKWFAFVVGLKGGKIELLVDYETLKYGITYNKETHWKHYYEGQDMITIEEGKELLFKYCKLKAFL